MPTRSPFEGTGRSRRSALGAPYPDRDEPEPVCPRPGHAAHQAWMTRWRNTVGCWGRIARALHWSMAVLIMAQFGLGWIAVNWRLSPAKLELFMWHKSLGVVLLLLALARLGWRAFNPAPRLPDTVPLGQRRLAALSHMVLYALMIAMPLSGWLINSAGNFPFRVFGILPWPDLTGPDDGLQALAETAHLTLFAVFVAALALHVGAALHHHVVGKDEVLSRMLPLTRQRRRPDTPT